MSVDTAVNVARRRLSDALGDSMASYLGHMKMWFKMKLTKMEFDNEARTLLSREQIHLHNEFLLSLLNKVEGLTEATLATAHERGSHSRNRRHKRSSRTSEKSSFEPTELLEYLSPSSPPAAGGDGVKYAVQEVFLPDLSLVVGRFMLAAWESGLDGAHDDAAIAVVIALQNFLKNLLGAVLSNRSGYKTRGNIVYDAGTAVANPWLRNAARLWAAAARAGQDEAGDHVAAMAPTIDEVEHETAMEIACSVVHHRKNNDKLSVNEFYETLLVNKNVIASHSIYAVNMERMITMLHHPSY